MPDDSTQAAPLLGAEPAAAPSTGSTSLPPEGVSRASAVDSDRTVISNRPPIAPPDNPAAVSPMEIGLSLRGQYLNHFQLGEFVGGGGMGAVFRAVDTKLDRIVAIKILSRSQTDEDVLRRFRNEAQSAARLDHPNIARVYDVGEDQGWNYIVFEFIDGTNIRDLVEQKGALSLEDALNYTLQVAEALEHAFRRDVVHRDIKPSNVLVMPGGRVKLVDMGLARLHQVESPAGDLTASGVTLGTFDYISPEQAYDPRSADVRSDIYSLGCTLYFVLTGRPPFPEGTAIQKLLSHTSDKPPDARLFRPKLPDEVAAILNKMLAKDPQHRYQEPSELIGEILLIADQLGLSSATGGGRVWVTPTRSEPSLLVRALPILLSLLALFTAVFVVDYLLSRPNPVTGDWPRPVLEEAALPAASLQSPLRVVEDEEPVAPSDDATVDQTDSARSETTASAVDNRSAGEATVVELPGDEGDVAASGATAGSSAPGEPSTSPRQETSSTVGLLPPDVGGAISIDLEDSFGELSVAAGDGELDDLALSAADPFVAPFGPVTAETAQMIIVVRGDSPPEEGALIVGSLKEAMETAARNANLSEVQLRFNGPMVEQPFSVAALGLTVRAGTGYSPTIVFRPTALQFENDRRMVRVQGGSVVFEDIHWRLALPRDPENDWSLFHLDQVESIDFRRCTMTVENVDEQGSELQDRVAFFQVEALPPIDALIDESAPAPTMPSINLSRCLARGRATLLRVEKVSPIVLNWDQGLLISSQRMVEVGGAMSRPAWGGSVRVELTHVTAVVKRGLCLMKSGSQTPYLLALDLDTADCIILTDPAAPLIEHFGIDMGDETRKYLQFSGDRDYFPNTSVVWNIVPEDVLADEIQYGFDLDSEKFPNVNLPGRDVMWRGLPADDAAIHLLEAEDYLLSDHPSNVAARSGEGRRPAGFDPQLLPRPPVVDINIMPAAPSTPQSSSQATVDD